jgi:hypothetical protein
MKQAGSDGQGIRTEGRDRSGSNGMVDGLHTGNQDESSGSKPKEKDPWSGPLSAKERRSFREEGRKQVRLFHPPLLGDRAEHLRPGMSKSN